MVRNTLIAAFGMIAAASPLSATSLQPAPPGDANTRYCMRVEPATGTRLEFVRCWTRQEWADRDVDVDKEWAKEGVSIITSDGRRP